MKLAAISQRGLARDFWDVYEVLHRTETSLTDVLRKYQKKYSAQDIGHVVRSLVYFGDAETIPLPSELSVSEWHRVRAFFENEVPKLCL